MNTSLHQSRYTGFTLVEMLVVLVILSLTTTLLSEGLSNTWRNFERLGARDMMTTSAQFPVNWFAESVAGAVLYHPYNPVVRGDEQRLEFITTRVPSDPKHIPQTIVWSIEPENAGWALIFTSELRQAPTKVMHFDVVPSFNYFYAGEWFKTFDPDDARLPEVVRINLGEDIYLMAKPDRPVIADMPAELPLFGQYEF